MANDGYPLESPLAKPSLMALLTGSALLAAGALLYGAGTSQAATLAPPANDGSRWALSAPGGATAPAWSNQAAWKDQANAFTAAQTVPNGTAAAPGIRLTSEATGLYSVGAGRVGVACAGAATADLSAPNGTTLGGVLRLASPSAAEVPQIYQTRADGAFYISGDSGPAAGGGLRVYGSAHATKANCVEFTRGNTVAGYFDGSGNLTCSGTVIVPNGTAAAPGIRLTSEAHGLYRNASTSLGVACAGAYVADFTGASAGNWAAFLRISTITDPGMIIGNSTNSLIIYGSDTGSSQGGQLRVYGSTHGSRASYVEFTRGATVSGYFDGSGKFFLNYTSTGAMRLAGNGDGSTGSIDSIYGDLLKYKRYGYSNSYSAAMLGAATRGISLGVDTSAIAGSSFAGNNNDILVNRGAVIRCANSGGTDWLAAIKISGGAVSASTPVLEIADSLATFIKPVSITDTTASTTPATGAHVVAGGVGIGGGLNVAGASGIGGSFNGSAVLTVGTTNPLTGATQVAVYAGMANTTAATTRVSAFYSAPTMTAGSYTTSYFAHFDGVGMTVPSGITVTNWHGLIINAPTFTGTVTNAYGIRSIIASGTNRWNLYLDGTASNYLNGQVLIGTTTDGMTAGGSLAIAQDLAHRGTKAGFYNATPVTRPTYAAWTGTANRATKDTATATLVDVAQTVKALVDDLRTVGLLA